MKASRPTPNQLKLRTAHLDPLEPKGLLSLDRTQIIGVLAALEEGRLENGSIFLKPFVCDPRQPPHQHFKEANMVTQDQVYDALRKCFDPEIPGNIVDLGLVYDVQVHDESVDVVMTLTARGCPAHTFISEDVRTRVASLPGVKSARVEVVWEPPWNPSRMSDAAKKRLGIL